MFFGGRDDYLLRDDDGTAQGDMGNIFSTDYSDAHGDMRDDDDDDDENKAKENNNNNNNRNNSNKITPPHPHVAESCGVEFDADNIEHIYWILDRAWYVEQFLIFESPLLFYLFLTAQPTARSQ